MKEFIPAESTVPVHTRIRFALMRALTQEVKSWNCTVEDMAHRLDTVPLRINHLLEAQAHRFTLEALIILCQRAGLNLEYYVKGLPE